MEETGSLEAEARRLKSELAAAMLQLNQLAENYSANEARQRILARLTHQLAATRNEPDAARVLEEALRGLFQYDAFLLDAYDEKKDEVRNVLTLDTLDGIRQETPPAYSGREPGPVARQVIISGAKLILREKGQSDDYGLLPFGDKGRRSLSLMFAPLRIGDRVLGTLSLQSYSPAAYSETELDQLQVTADLCGGAFERIRTEAELHAREAQYQQIVETTQEGVWVVDADGLTTFVNRRMAQMLGYTPEEMLGRSAFDFIVAESRGETGLETERQHVLPHDQQDMRLRCKDGSVLWTLVTSNPLPDAEGKFTGALALLTDISQRKRVEEELKESEARFQAFMGNLTGFAFIKDHRSRYIYVNSLWERIFGRKRETVRGLTDADLLPPAIAKEFQAAEAKLRQDKKLLQVVESIGEGAAARSYIVSMFLIPDERPGEEMVGGIAVDITERLQIQEQLRETQARSQAILEAAMDAVVTIDSEGKIVEFNPAAEKMFGYRNAQVLGQRMGDLIVPPETRARHEAALAHAVGGGKSGVVQRMIELEAMRRDGSRFPVELTIVGVEHGPRPLFTGFIRDITARRAAGAALHLSEERYRTLISASVSVVWTTNAAGDFEAAQPSWEAYTGQTWEHYRGRGWLQAIHEDDRNAVAEAWERSVSTRLPYNAVGRIFSMASGTWRYFLGRGMPLLNENGTVREWIGTMTDIDAQKRAEFEFRQLNESLERRVAERTEKLEATNKELETFCYSVSHDLRAPLRAIDGFSQALEEDYGPMLDQTGRSYIERVRRSTHRMSNLIDDLLELSRIARADLRMQDVDLSSLAKLVMEELQAIQQDRKVEWIVAPQLKAKGDSRLLRVVLDNLLGNAWKFTRNQQHPTIEFGMTIQEGKTVYFVRDNGAGFDMAYADKLFGVFQRLHSATDYEGTGVGLANVQRVVHRHGGQVWAHSSAGAGATFYFTLASQGKES